MKRASIVAALLFSVVSGVIAEAQSEGQRAAAEAERAVRQQDQERIHAQIAADTIALRRIYADDFLGIGPTGVVRNKSEVVADFTSHALTYQSITTSDVLVRVYGNTAVETGRSTMVGRDRGKTVPRDVAVIGFDDRDVAQYMHPPLSTLVLPLYEMGRVAVELILDDAGGLHSSASGIKVECKLVERESTRADQSALSEMAAG